MLVLASISESLVNETSHFVRDAGLPGDLRADGDRSSACIPIPSEVVMLFAGFAVADPGQSAAHHHLTMIGIVLAGLLGTMVGSWVAYARRARRAPGAARTPRREAAHGPGQIERADRWFQRYGEPRPVRAHDPAGARVRLAARRRRADAVRALHRVLA